MGRDYAIHKSTKHICPTCGSVMDQVGEPDPSQVICCIELPLKLWQMLLTIVVAMLVVTTIAGLMFQGAVDMGMIR